MTQEMGEEPVPLPPSHSGAVHAKLRSWIMSFACGVNTSVMTQFQAEDFGFAADDRGRADAPDSWCPVPQRFRAQKPLPSPGEELFGPLKTGAVDDLVVVGQFGQSLDGRVATETGHSHYINGPEGLAHLHRLRALVDVVVVGVGTAIADDPQLTVRHVAGPCPARAVVDPRGRIGKNARLFAPDGGPRLSRRAEGGPPADILAALAARGFRRILIEGGSHTVSRFIAAGCLDRLHIVVAPIILGAGRGGVALAPGESCAEALRPPMRLHRLDGEGAFDCDLSARRIAGGRAKQTT